MSKICRKITLLKVKKSNPTEELIKNKYLTRKSAALKILVFLRKCVALKRKLVS